MQRISIVTVTYNCNAIIRETIESVLSQNYVNKEYIIVDGMSSDGTLDIVKEYNDKLTLISEKDRGIFDAMNKSLLHITGEYVIFINAGDKFVNNHVLEDIFYNKVYSADLLYGDHYVQNDLGYIFRKAEPIYLNKPTKADLVYKSQGFCHQSLFTKSSILKIIQFNLNYPLGADYDTTAKIYNINNSIEYVGIPISVFDDRTGGASHNKLIKIMKERAMMFDYRKTLSFYIKVYYWVLVSFVKRLLIIHFPFIVNKFREKKYSRIITC